jgi:hypothetical protein
MSDWKFRRRQGWCSACETRFAEGDRHVSALLIQGEELCREDHCLACFGQRSSQGDLFFWYTRHHAKKRALALDLSTLEQLFLQLEGRLEPRVRELRYVLCLLLMRKRRLKLDRVLRGSEGEGESMLCHRPRRKEALRVFVFDFTPERMQVLRGDLVGLLEGAEPASFASEGSQDESTDPTDANGPAASLLETVSDGASGAN